MMYYIKSKPNDNGNYENPTVDKFEDSIMLPNELLADYLNYKGFVIPTVKDGVVTEILVNQEALDSYLAEYPDVEEKEQPTEAEQMRADIDYLAIMTGVEL